MVNIYAESDIPEYLAEYFQPAEYGQEETLDEYVATMVALFRELRRVLAKDGTFWLNIGDSYQTTDASRGSTTERSESSIMGKNQANAQHRTHTPGLAPKNLMGVPWRTALALQADGWILRNEVIWHKPNGMPESVTDRLSSKHEHMFMFTRSPKYWFDLYPIREKTGTEGMVRKDASRTTPYNVASGLGSGTTGQLFTGNHPDGKNPGDVWSITTQPFMGAHFATFPQELVRRCILSGCKPGGVVLDPFSGSGTTGLVAQNHGRKYVGIDINPEYHDLALHSRLSNGVLDLEGMS